MVERFDNDMSHDLQSATQIIPDRDAELIAGLCEAQKSITAIAADIASCSRADLPARDLTADVVLRSVGVERDFRPVEDEEQLRLVGVEAGEQAIELAQARFLREAGNRRSNRARNVRARRWLGLSR